MSGIPTDLSCARVVRALQRAGFSIVREGRHAVMAKGDRLVVVPRHTLIKRETLRAIVKDAGLSIDAFCELI